MKILIVSPEIGDVRESNSLGDVVKASAQALIDLGHEVKIFSPFYDNKLDQEFEYNSVYKNIDIIKFREFEIIHNLEETSNYYIKYGEYFERDGIYNVDSRPYEDNHLRYSLLGLATLQYCKDIKWIPEKIICHEWASGLTCAYAKDLYGEYFGNIPLHLSVQDLKYDFYAFDSDMTSIGLNPQDYHINGFEFWGKISLLKAGLFYCDKIVLSSRGYLKRVLSNNQILTGGLQAFLQGNENKLLSIQNGIEYDYWSLSNYSPSEEVNVVSIKQSLQKKLCEDLNFVYSSKTPLVYCRIDNQSGKLLNTLSTIMSNLLSQNIQFVIAISPNHPERSYLDMIVSQHSSKVAIVEIGTNEDLRNRLAACDMIFSTALEEPSAALLLKAMALGTVPVTTRQNGCENYLISYSIPMDDDVVAFVSEGEEPDRMLRSLREAENIFQNNLEEWQSMVINNTNLKRTWEKVAHDYISIK